MNEKLSSLNDITNYEDLQDLYTQKMIVKKI